MFKMKRVPVAPKNKIKVTKEIEVHNLQEAVDYFKGCNFSDVKLKAIIDDSYYDSVVATYNCQETDEEFAARQSKYQDDLKVYKEWEKANAANIKIYKEKRAEYKKNLEAQKAATEKINILKELDKIQKRQEALAKKEAALLKGNI